MDVSTLRDAVRHPRLVDGAVAAWTAGLIAIVVADGAIGWRLVRAAVVVVVAIVVHLTADRHRRVGGVALLALGIVGIDVGITFGIRFPLEEGISIRAIAGVVVLAASLVLPVIGGRRLTDGQGRRRFATVPALVILFALLVRNTVPAVLVTNVPSIARGPETPAAYGLVAEDVRFDAADGTGLAGWYVPSRNGAAVVVRHGAGSTADAQLAQATVLVEHGYGVLITDARGHGESDGRAMDFGWYGDDDIAGAVSFLEERADVDPERIGVVGFSMGGEEAIGAIAADDRIRAVVAEGATVRTDDDRAWFDDVYGVRGRLQQAFEWVGFRLTDALTDASEPTPLAEAAGLATPRPILLITAGEVADERHAAEHIRGGAPDSVTIWEVPDAGHTEGYATDPGEWEARVVAFLDAALLDPETSEPSGP